MTSTCRHCGKRIVLVNWAMGPGWTHQPEGASFQDGMHRYCHRTVAEPSPLPPPPPLPAETYLTIRLDDNTASIRPAHVTIQEKP